MRKYLFVKCPQNVAGLKSFPELRVMLYTESEVLGNNVVSVIGRLIVPHNVPCFECPYMLYLWKSGQRDVKPLEIGSYLSGLGK